MKNDYFQNDLARVSKEVKKVIMFDLNCLKDFRNSPADFKYHYALLKGNLQDLFKPNQDQFKYAKENLKTDIQWLEGYGVSAWEAEKFVKYLLFHVKPTFKNEPK